MFLPNELAKLVTDAPRYENCRIIKGEVLMLYNKTVFLYDLKTKHKEGLAYLIKKAKEAYEAEQTRD